MFKLTELLFLLFLLAATFQGTAQWKFIMEFEINDEGKDVDGVEIKVYLEGALVETVLTDSKGRADSPLFPDGEYYIEVGGNKGLIKKIFIVNTYNVPPNKMSGDYFYVAKVELFKKQEGMNLDMLKNPIAKVFYDPDFGDFKAEQISTELEEKYTIVEDMPIFPGCEDKGTKLDVKYCTEQQTLNFIYTNVNYPAAMKDAGISGTVYVRYVIDEEGLVKDIKVLQGIPGGKALDDEAVRVISLLPKMIPGTQKGKQVKVQYTVPVRFNLEDARFPETFRNEKKVKRKDIAKAMNSSQIRYLEITSMNEDGLEEWITINPMNGDTVLYQAVLGNRFVGRWKSIRKKRIYTGSVTYFSNDQYEIIERKFDLLKYDTSLSGNVIVPDEYGIFSDSGESFEQYAASRIEYPIEVRELQIQGTAYARLRLDKDGFLHFEGILRGVHQFLDIEILRIVESCPQWFSPGKINGEPVEYTFVMPFKWSLK